MANNDPVSGLMASMSRVRARRPDGLAAEAGTAAQAGTVQSPPPAPPKPPADLRPFERVLPARPQPQPMPEATAPLETPVNAPLSLEQPDTGPQALVAVPRVANAFLENADDLDLPDAYLLALGLLYGVRGQAGQAQSQPQVPPAPIG
jgi:hypothetical protein